MSQPSSNASPIIGPPFTVSADLDLGTRVTPYLAEGAADVAIFAGDVPEHLAAPTANGVAYEVAEGEFLLKLPSGTRYLVRNGQEIIYQRQPGISDRDVALFLLGSAWGALCYQRDLLPLHASAVSLDGQIVAFTGQSGAGKSTLSAALAAKGLDFFTDDVLIIDPATIGGDARCYSGQKDLKLWGDSFGLAQADQLGAVRDLEGFDKFFAAPANSDGSVSGQFAALMILSSLAEKAGGGEKTGPDDKSGNGIQIARIAGGDALLKLSTSVYRPRYAEHIWGRRKLYQALGKLIAAIGVYRFDRPFLKSEFDVGVDAMKHWIEHAARKERSGGGG